MNRINILSVVCFCAALTSVGAQGTGKLAMASGWSVQDSEKAAIKEARDMIGKTVQSPDFLVLFSRSGYNFNLLSKELNQAYPGAKVFGLSVQHAVFTAEGIHRGTKSALALLAMDSPSMAFGVGSSHIDSVATAETQIRKAIDSAIANAGKTKQDRPNIVFLGSTDQYEEKIVETVSAVFGSDVQIMGGTTVKEDGSKGTVIANSTVVAEGFSIALLYGDVPLGAAFHSGFISKQYSGKVTKARGRLIQEIDGKPAFDVYRTWTSPEFDKLDPSTTPDIALQAAKIPLAKSIKTADGSTANIVAVPFAVNPDKSMRMGVSFAPGDTVSLVSGTPDALIKRAGTVARKAIINGKIKLASVAGGIQIYCIGAALIGIGVERLGEIPPEIAKEMKGAPFIGGFFGGEQGSYAGFGSCHANLTSDMVVFGK